MGHMSFMSPNQQWRELSCVPNQGRSPTGLQTTYGISDIIHRWFRSYLLGQLHYVQIRSSCSSVINLICSIPRGSVLGPVLFILVLYTTILIALIESHSLTTHLHSVSKMYATQRPMISLTVVVQFKRWFNFPPHLLSVHTSSNQLNR